MRLTNEDTKIFQADLENEPCDVRLSVKKSNLKGEGGFHACVCV